MDSVLTPDAASTVCPHTQPGHVYYTDGSAMDVPTPNGSVHATGAAFVTYDPALVGDHYEAHLLKPSRPGVFNENYRAELVGIHAALLHANARNASEPCAVHVYTDSLSSIQAIKQAIFNPHNVRRKLHFDLVGEIARIIIRRSQSRLHTHLHKVKSHADVEGNERADTAAKEAAQLSVTSTDFGSLDYCGYRETIPEYWMTAVPIRDSDDPPDESEVCEYMRNPRKETSRHLENHSLDLFPVTTIYARGLVAEHNMISLKRRCHAWADDITDAQKRTAIRTLTGQILNFKLISLWTKGRTAPNCPLCQKLDSTSHIVCGGCTHRDMHSAVIKRHDNAVRIATSSVLTGDMGDHAIMADVTIDPAPDVGPDEASLQHGTEPLPKRLPAHLIAAMHARIRRALDGVAVLREGSRSTDSLICTLLFRKYGADGGTYAAFRTRMRPIVNTISFRPDMAVFIGGSRSHARWSMTEWCGYAGDKCVHLVELGYTREGFASAKQLEKQEQHALLVCLLRDLKWTVHLHTITLGVTGTVYMDGLTTLKALGLSLSGIDKVVRSWIRMTMNHTHGLLTRRRQLDGHYVNAAFAKPP
jgi:ribonuclease HI